MSREEIKQKFDYKEDLVAISRFVDEEKLDSYRKAIQRKIVESFPKVIRDGPFNLAKLESTSEDVAYYLIELLATVLRDQEVNQLRAAAKP